MNMNSSMFANIQQNPHQRTKVAHMFWFDYVNQMMFFVRLCQTDTFDVQLIVFEFVKVNPRYLIFKIDMIIHLKLKNNKFTI